MKPTGIKLQFNQLQVGQRVKVTRRAIWRFGETLHGTITKIRPETRTIFVLHDTQIAGAEPAPYTFRNVIIEAE